MNYINNSTIVPGRAIHIPTGYLFNGNYSNGTLETLSIGDYGKRHNVHADFLGYNDEITGVDNQPCAPLSEKWVVTLSTQYGCPMNCTFCDVPKIGFHGNATFEDLYNQLLNAISFFPDVHYTERLNLHFARMGEPSYNDNILDFTEWLWYSGKRDIKEQTGLSIDVLHPVFTTSLPKKLKKLPERINRWVAMKNNLYNGQAGLQLSINSTNDSQRDEMFSGKAMDLVQISNMVSSFPEPIGRKYCLNFALADNYEVDAHKLSSLFDTNKWMVKITPIHNNTACFENGIKTTGGYDSYLPYKKAENDLKEAGFDVLVFVPSMDEEDGLVTCGNLVLSGSEVKNEIF